MANEGSCCIIEVCPLCGNFGRDIYFYYEGAFIVRGCDNCIDEIVNALEDKRGVFRVDSTGYLFGFRFDLYLNERNKACQY